MMRRGWVWMLLSLHAALPPGRSEKSSLRFWVRNSHWDENFQRIIKRDTKQLCQRRKSAGHDLKNRRVPWRWTTRSSQCSSKPAIPGWNCPQTQPTDSERVSEATHWGRKKVKPNLDGKSVFNNTKKPKTSS